MYVKERFELAPRAVASLKAMQPYFGYGQFGEVMMYKSYSHPKVDGSPEDWADICVRCINGTFSIRKDWYLKTGIAWDEDFWQDYARGMAESMFRMEWTPPGRGLWMMGTEFMYARGSMALYNCFTGATKFYDGASCRRLDECIDQSVRVLDASGVWQDATVRKFGRQKLQRIVFKPHSVGNRGPFGGSKLRLVYEATRNHRWILADGTETTHLTVKDKVRTTSGFKVKNEQEYINGLAHGMVFGDGTQQTAYPDRYSIRLCDDPTDEWFNKIKRSSFYRTDCSPPSYGGDRNVTFVDQGQNWKRVPVGKCLSYLSGFFDGWIQADAHDKPAGTIELNCGNAEAIDWAIEHAGLVGYHPVGLSQNNFDTNFGKRTTPLNRLTLTEDAVTYMVESITFLDEQDVYCVIQPTTKSFTLAGGIPTGNCNFTRITSQMWDDLHWMMDSLMHGCGVGFLPERDDIVVRRPTTSAYNPIPDSREGWCESVRWQIHSWCDAGIPKPQHFYGSIRPAGKIIKSFGGIASGPAPLIRLHILIDECFERYIRGECDIIMLKTDLANAIGVCVISGNVRRSAELAAGWMDDTSFINLKDYSKYPYRAEFGYMSNNSVFLEDDVDFNRLGEIAKRVIANGEPGIINRRNISKGRLGRDDRAKEDKAEGFNPCGEVQLEHREVCNVAETYPLRCNNVAVWLKACEYCTVYMSTVSLLPTHQPSTNAVVARNRRIGASIVNVTGWMHEAGAHNVIKYMRQGFDRVQATNAWVNDEAGVPRSIRTTCIKPGGTTPKMVGQNSGCGFPTFEETLVRFKVGKHHPIAPLLIEAGVPYEQDIFESDTWLFEYPIVQGPSKPATKASLFEQAMIVMMVQHEWADNAVSNTLYFRPKWVLERIYKADQFDAFYDRFDFNPRAFEEHQESECLSLYEGSKFTMVYEEGRLTKITLYTFDPHHEEDDIEPVLSMVAPHIKSISLLPHTADGVYEQMPQSGLTRDEYTSRLADIRPIDWSKLKFSTPEGEGYCSGGSCVRT